MWGGTFKNWDSSLAKATWLVNIRGSTNQAGPAEAKLSRPVERDKVPVVHMQNMLGKGSSALADLFNYSLKSLLCICHITGATTRTSFAPQLSSFCTGMEEIGKRKQTLLI